jgi:DNA-binding beta-propeller fold protein YncE
MKKSVLLVLVAAATSICSGQWLERQVVLGDTFGGVGYPGELVVNPISGNVYIQTHPVQLFNPVTMEKLRGPRVSGAVVFCPPSGKGYVVRDSLVIIDAVADTVVGVTVPPFPTRAFAYSRTSNRLYLASDDDTCLMVFDPDGDSIVKIVGVGAVEALLWDSIWNRLYIATWTETAPWCPIRVLDCVTDTLMSDIQVGFEGWDKLVLSTLSHKLYCTGIDTNGRGALVVVSTDSLKPLGTVPGLYDHDIIGYNPVTDRLYVYDDSFYVVDCRGDTILRTREFDADISALVASSLTGRVYLGIDDSPQIMVMDTADSIVDTIQLPGTARVWNEALTFSPDRNQLYGATGWDGIAFAVDASFDTLTGWVSYGRYDISNVLHNPAGNKVYLVSPGQDEVLVMDSTFGSPKRVHCSMTSSQPVLNQSLNRLYVATGSALQVIDCNTDSFIASRVIRGIGHPIPVMVPYLNKLYIFSAEGPDSAYAYDCLRDQVSSIFYLSTPVTGAVYDPRSNRVFFSCGPAPTVRALDPVTDSVVKTFDLVSTPYHGRMAINVDLGLLYYTDQLPTRLFTIDVLADSVVSSESLPWGVEGLFLNRRQGKLYMCSSDPARSLVYDCNRKAVADTIDAGFVGAGLMNDRNDKLYLGYGVVIDCRYDSVVARLDSFGPSSMAWDAIDNRVFEATTSRLYVYRDDPYGIVSEPVEMREQRHATIVRGVLFLPRDMTEIRPGISDRVPRPILLDISGRRVLDLKPGANDVRALSAGVYFVRQVVGSQTTKVVIQR